MVDKAFFSYTKKLLFMQFGTSSRYILKSHAFVAPESLVIRGVYFGCYRGYNITPEWYHFETIVLVAIIIIAKVE